MAAPPPKGYLPDTNILAFARAQGLPLADFVGCRPDQLAVPQVVLDECLARVQPGHPLADEYLEVIAGLPLLPSANPAVLGLAEILRTRYAAHGAKTPDTIIAATALTQERVLLSTNWRHFHFVEGLWLIDARYLHRGPSVPVLAWSPGPHRGPILPPPPCCNGLIAAGVLPRRR